MGCMHMDHAAVDAERRRFGPDTSQPLTHDRFEILACPDGRQLDDPAVATPYRRRGQMGQTRLQRERGARAGRFDLDASRFGSKCHRTSLRSIAREGRRRIRAKPGATCG